MLMNSSSHKLHLRNKCCFYVPYTCCLLNLYLRCGNKFCLNQRSEESRRDQEEGGELDSHKEASPGRWCWARERVGLLLLQLFPNGGATDIVFVTLFCIVFGTAIACGAAVAAQCRTDTAFINVLLFWRRSTAALVFRVGACFEVPLFCPPFPLVPVPNRPSRLRGR